MAKKPEVQIEPEFIVAAMKHPAVRAELRRIADNVAREAEAVGDSHDYDMNIRVVEETRGGDGGRPVFNVTAEAIPTVSRRRRTTPLQILQEGARRAI